MASQSLYRKWRSQTFSDLVGQEAVARTLLNAVREGRLAHAYLFCGPRGTGKTSVARLLAKAINCQNPQNGEPCNECVSCQEIATGRSPDVIEIDAASNNGIENIRDIRDNANLIGSGGRYKVYVVDECHMLSTPAFNALLKTLEEPPPHVIFVLATTEAHKVLPTVVSRCQRFDFHRIALRDIVAHLERVAKGEGLELEPAAAELLARSAQGGMRDALSLLDQAVAYCGPRIQVERARAMLGLADVTALRRLIACVADNRPADGLEIIHELVTTGADLRQLSNQLAEEWRAMMLARAGGDVTHLMDRGDDEAREIAALAERFSLDQLMACARAFTRNEGPARGLPVPQLALELSFLECVSIARGLAHGIAPAVAVEQPAPRQAPEPPRAPAAVPPPAPRRQQAPQEIEELDLAAIDNGSWAGPSTPPTREPETPGAPVAISIEPVEIHPVEDASARPPAAEEGDWVEQARQQWALIRKVCKQKTGLGSTVYSLLNDAEPLRLEPGSPPTLIIAARHDFHLKSLREDPKREIVEWALEQALGASFRARFVAAGDSQPGMAAAQVRRAPVASRVTDQAATRPVRENPSEYQAPQPSRASANGRASQPAKTPVSPPGAPAPANANPASTSDLDEAARQDPVVLEFVRHGLEVAEVRPLEPDDGSNKER